MSAPEVSGRVRVLLVLRCGPLRSGEIVRRLAALKCPMYGSSVISTCELLALEELVESDSERYGKRWSLTVAGRREAAKAARLLVELAGA